MAQINVTNGWDLSSIAKAAGSTSFECTLNNGVFVVPDVSQQDLDDALTAYVHDALKAPRDYAKSLIDMQAEQARLRYVTGGAGQAMAYQEKADEASDYVAAGYPVDLSSYPFIQAEINATGKTKEAAADDILTQRSAWITVGASIEEERLGGKKAVDDAVDQGGIDTARDAALAALEAI